MPLPIRLLAFAVLLAIALSLPSPVAAQSTAALPAPAPASADEEAAVRIPLEAYLRGHATGDKDAFRRAFWPEARLWWVRDGQLATRTSEEYINGGSGRPAADEAQRKRRIVSVHVTGNAAIGIIELDYPATRFIDYMALLKVGDEWRIINKSFHAEPRAR